MPALYVFFSLWLLLLLYISVFLLSLFTRLDTGPSFFFFLPGILSDLLPIHDGAEGVCFRSPLLAPHSHQIWRLVEQIRTQVTP